MPDIKHFLTIAATSGTVYKALTEKTGIQGWWTHDTTIHPETGTLAEFNFGEYHNEMKIVDLQSERRVEWVCLEGDPEWINTRFIFELESKGDQTVLRFTHTGWREMTDFFGSCNFNWAYYLTSLKAYCETGAGTPFIIDK